MHLARFGSVLAFLTAACTAERLDPPSPPPASARSGASPLARELGADDAGRGWLEVGECPAARATKFDRSRPLGAPSSRAYASIMAPESPSQVGFFETLAAPPEASRGSAPIRLELRAPPRAERGHGIALQLAVRNAGEDDVVLPRALDGSFEHWRAPSVDVVLKDLGNAKTYRFAPGPGYGRCGNVNAKQAEDWVTIAPGQTVDDALGPWARRSLDVVIDVPGRYAMWVVYTACVWPERGVTLAMDRETPAAAFEGQLTSAPVLVEVR